MKNIRKLGLAALVTGINFISGCAAPEVQRPTVSQQYEIPEDHAALGRLALGFIGAGLPYASKTPEARVVSQGIRDYQRNEAIRASGSNVVIYTVPGETQSVQQAGDTNMPDYDHTELEEKLKRDFDQNGKIDCLFTAASFTDSNNNHDAEIEEFRGITRNVPEGRNVIVVGKASGHAPFFADRDYRLVITAYDNCGNVRKGEKREHFPAGSHGKIFASVNLGNDLKPGVYKYNLSLFCGERMADSGQDSFQVK